MLEAFQSKSTLTGLTVTSLSALTVLLCETYSRYDSVMQTIGANSSGSKTVKDCMIKKALRLTNPRIIPMKLAIGKAALSSIFLRSISIR